MPSPVAGRLGTDPVGVPAVGVPAVGVPAVGVPAVDVPAVDVAPVGVAPLGVAPLGVTPVLPPEVPGRPPVVGASSSPVSTPGGASVVEVLAVVPVVEVVVEVEVEEEVDAVVVVVVMAHAGRVIELESRVTAPLRASRRPTTDAPVLAVTEVRARTEPTNTERVPRVAELPTCQNTLQACAPFVSATALVVPVTRVLPARKMNTASGSP